MHQLLDGMMSMINLTVISVVLTLTCCELINAQNLEPTSATNVSEYAPVNLAYATHNPVGGADETLSPIIFLHGVTLSKESWINVPQIIADRTKRKAYSVDSRNHGDSEWSDVFSYDINTDDLLHFMDTISVPTAVIVGHSMGGLTALRTALKSPNRTEKIFVEESYVKRYNQEVLDGVVEHTQLIIEAVKQLPVDCPEEDVAREIMKFLAEKVPGFELPENHTDQDYLYRLKFPVKRDAAGRYVLKTNTDVIIKALKNADTIMSEPKGLYEGPSYFIYGTNSSLKVNEDEENIRKFFPRAEIIEVKNADHSIHNQFPEKIINLVVEKILN